MTSEIADRIFAAAAANIKAIEGCPGPHDFAREDRSSVRCRKCGGVASEANVYWYKAGIAQGAKNAAQR